MHSDRKLKTLYRCAYDYLKDKIGQEALEQKLMHYRQYKAMTMQDVFWHMLNSLKNKSSMPQTIGDIDPLAPCLFDFDPWKTNAHYQDRWETLFEEIRANHSPPGPMHRTRPNSYWAIFCRGALSGAEFLSRFQSHGAFDEFVNTFALNDLSLAGLPIIIGSGGLWDGIPVGM